MELCLFMSFYTLPNFVTLFRQNGGNNRMINFFSTIPIVFHLKCRAEQYWAISFETIDSLAPDYFAEIFLIRSKYFSFIDRVN